MNIYRAAGFDEMWLVACVLFGFGQAEADSFAFFFFLRSCALQLLAAKQRMTHGNDWMTTDTLVALSRSEFIRRSSGFYEDGTAVV